MPIIQGTQEQQQQRLAAQANAALDAVRNANANKPATTGEIQALIATLEALGVLPKSEGGG